MQPASVQGSVAAVEIHVDAGPDGGIKGCVQALGYPRQSTEIVTRQLWDAN
jgi:hypothetical protein